MQQKHRRALALFEVRDAMVAAHAWDIAGAASAGCQTAFVARPGKVFNPVGIQPDMKGDDMSEVVEKILARQA